MKLKRLKITNLFRFADTEIDFQKYPENSSVIVLGRNFDTMGADSNGSGKSSLFEAISWIIFGKPLRKSFVTDIIRRGEKDCSGELTIDNHEGKEVTIIRSRKLNQSGFDLTLTVDGVDVTGRTNTQRKIFQYLGFSDSDKAFLDFQNTILLSRTTLDLFASSSTTAKERIDTIKRFLGIDILNDCLILVREELKGLDVSLSKLDEEIASTKGRMLEFGTKESLTYQIESLRGKLFELSGSLDLVVADIDQTFKASEELSRYHKQLNEITILAGSIEVIDSQLDRKRMEIVGIKEKISAVDPSLNNLLTEIADRISKLDTDIADSKSKYNGLQDSLKTKNSDLEKLKAQLRDSSLISNSITTCPHCSGEILVRAGKLFVADSNSIDKLKADLQDSISVLEKDILQLSKDAKYLLGFFNDYTTLRDSLLVTRKELIERINEKNVLSGLLSSQQQEFDKMVEYRESESSRYAAWKDALDDKYPQFVDKDAMDLKKEMDSRLKVLYTKKNSLEVDKMQVTNSISVCEDSLFKIDKLGKLLKIAEGNKERLEQRKSNISFWTYGFPEVSRMIIDNALPFFEDRVNYYLTGLDTNERVRFETLVEKRSAEGEFKSGFDIQLWDGNTWAGFDMFSEGERTRVALAISFALRDLVAKVSFVPTGFFLCDEIADSIDSTGMKKFFELLQDIPGQKFVISHKSTDELIGMADNSIVIERRDNVSTIQN